MKKALSYILTVMLLLGAVFIPTENLQAYEANISIGLSSSSVKIGDSVSVSVSVPSNVSGPVALYFPTDLLEFSSASATVNQSGGTVLISIGPDGLAKTSKVTVTFKAKTSGTATVSASSAGDIYDDQYEEVTLKGASASIEIANESSEDEKSPDNSLSSIKLSKGTLSPSFKYNVTKYTAKVGYDVTSITISAKTSHDKATIESITGNGTVSLSVGENTIQIVVKAENGQKATYTVVVTREPQGSEDDEDESESESETESETENEDDGLSLEDILQWQGKTYEVPGSIPSDMIPADFTQDTIVIANKEIPCLSFSKADLTVLCLKNENGANELFVFDRTSKSIYPFVKIQSEKSYAMILLPDETNVPEGVGACTLSIEGKGVVYAYQFSDAAKADFYLVYCMNDKGSLGWYLYDKVEGTIQRFVEEGFGFGSVVGDEIDNNATDIETSAPTDVQTQNVQLQKELSKAKLVQMIAIIVAAVLAVLLIIVLILLLRKRSNDGFDGEEMDEDEDEDFIDEEELDEREYNRRGYGEYPVVKAKEPEVVVEPEVVEDDELEIEFYEMESEDDEIDIEFFEMEPEEDEIEIEFFEMEPEEDELEIEFFEMEPDEKPVVEKKVIPERQVEDLEDDDIEFLD